jgi:hypothetical protein
VFGIANALIAVKQGLFAFLEYGTLRNDAACKRSNPERKKALKKMKSSFLQKQPSRRDIVRGSVTLAVRPFWRTFLL